MTTPLKPRNMPPEGERLWDALAASYPAVVQDLGPDNPFARRIEHALESGNAGLLAEVSRLHGQYERQLARVREAAVQEEVRPHVPSQAG